MSPLQELRQELEKLNLDLVRLVKKRKEIAGRIQIEKNSLGKEKFDPARELSLFKSMDSELRGLSLKELASFSLLMEEHAGEGYPLWSRGEHLSPDFSRNGSVVEIINPLLILLFYSDLIKVESLKKEYRFLAELTEVKNG